MPSAIFILLHMRALLGKSNGCLIDHFRGCVTPKQIENLVKEIGGLEGMKDDLDVIDGYDEVGEENQRKIRTALEEGHVPDEDWKGVS